LEGLDLSPGHRLSLPLLTTRSRPVHGRVKIDLNFLPKRKSRQGQFPGELEWMGNNGNLGQFASQGLGSPKLLTELLTGLEATVRPSPILQI